MSDKLFYSPAALDGAAVFITAFMGALDINCEVVDVVSKKSVGGEDLKTLNPLETVPFVITSDGLLLSEQQVILDYLVDKVSKIGYFEFENKENSNNFARTSNILIPSA